MGQDKPVLKKCFKDEKHALEIFEKELKANLTELQKHGLFFSFTTDPMLKNTKHLTVKAIDICMIYCVPVKILTKIADWLEGYTAYNEYIPFPFLIKGEYKSKIAFGFTLTGQDELEPNASPNQERIEAMKKLHDAGFKIFASIEPIIDFKNSGEMISKTIGFCDQYKIGLQSGINYNRDELLTFVSNIMFIADNIYFKDSLLKQAGIKRDELPENCVTRDFNLFTNN